MLWSLSDPVAIRDPVTSLAPKLASMGPRSAPSVAQPPASHDPSQSLRIRKAPSFEEAAISSSVGCSATSAAAVRSVAQVRLRAPAAASTARSGASADETIRSRGIRARTSRALTPPPSGDTSTPPFPRSSGVGSRTTIPSWRNTPSSSVRAVVVVAPFCDDDDDDDPSSPAVARGDGGVPHRWCCPRARGCGCRDDVGAKDSTIRPSRESRTTVAAAIKTANDARFPVTDGIFSFFLRVLSRWKMIRCRIRGSAASEDDCV
mmetsp:Transcript_20390/g.47886  ORF Transcript_20390/g.47886 Transcript_20390/m.47886 type:complete len:262 (-) Transcript_20390:66-851(-)